MKMVASTSKADIADAANWAENKGTAERKSPSDRPGC